MTDRDFLASSDLPAPRKNRDRGASFCRQVRLPPNLPHILCLSRDVRRAVPTLRTLYFRLRLGLRFLERMCNDF